MSRLISSSELLSKVQVAKPCPADWRHMEGDDRIRHCTQCSRNVYNISEMSRQEASDLIEAMEGKMCVRYFTRPDGTVMTKDCGASVRETVRNTTRFALVMSSILGLIGLSAALMAFPKDTSETSAVSVSLFGSFPSRLLDLIAGRSSAPGSTSTGVWLTGKPCVARPTMGTPAPHRPSKPNSK
jgi:hypothetical protein